MSGSGGRLEKLPRRPRRIEIRPPDDRIECDVALVISEVSVFEGGAKRQITRLANRLSSEGLRVAVIAPGCTDAKLPFEPSVMRVDPVLRMQQAAEAGRPRLRVLPTRLSALVRTKALKRIERRLLDPLIVSVVASARSARHRGKKPRCRDAFLYRAGRRRLGGKFVPFDQAIRQLRTQCVVAFLSRTNVYAAISLRSRGARLVVSHRTDMRLVRTAEPLKSMQYLAHVRADLVTANSAGSVRALEALPELRSKPVAISPNIADSFRTDEPGRGHQFFVVGRLIPEKRVMRALDAFARVSSQLPSWRLVIAGQGPEESVLRERARGHGLESRIDFLGFVTQVPELLRKGGVLLHLSAFEGTPNVIMEAMAAGIPSIITDASPGPVELIAADEELPCGIVCGDGDWAGVESAMVRMASDDGLRARLGRAGLRRAELLTWPAVRGDWLRILDL